MQKQIISHILNAVISSTTRFHVVNYGDNANIVVTGAFGTP